MDALLDLVSEHGYADVTVEQIARRAGGRPGELEELFGSKEGCAIAVLEGIAEDNLRVVRRAFESAWQWPDSLRAAAYAQAQWIQENPEKMRFGMLEMLWASELTSAVRDNLIAEYLDMVDAGRSVASDPGAVPALAAESVIGSIAQTMTRSGNIGDDDLDPFAPIPEMMYLAVRPYLGEEAARKELTMARPQTKTETQVLPRGRHGLPRELVVENQRARLISGMIGTVAEQGYAKATIANVIAAARVSRKTFYESFANREDCYRAAYEATFEFLRDRVAAGSENEEWPESVRAGIAAFLESLGAHPDLAAFFLISPGSVGDESAERHRTAIRELVDVLLAKMPADSEFSAATEIRAEALAGGLSRLAAMQVSSDRATELPALLPDLVELFLRPYLGIEEAIRVAREDER